MQTIKAFLDQSLGLWRESTSAARLAIVLLTILCLGGVVGVGIWSVQPDYMILASGLDYGKSNQLMATLDQNNIGYEIKGAGSIIMVDKRNFNRASILAGTRGIGQPDADLESPSPWMDPVNQQNLLRRNLERKLEVSIEKYSDIESATVHLSIPERQPFLRTALNPTASVVLKIAHNKRFSETHAATISQLIANAVPGMRADQVAITDTDGNVYTSDESLGRLSKQEEYRVNRERELAMKVQTMLVNFLGVGNSQVAITADFSFPEGKTTIKEFDPDKKVLTSESIDSSSSSGEGILVAGGLAGTSSNVGNNRNSGNSNQNTKTETTNLAYEVSSTLREDVVRTPVMNLMTVSVLVNSSQVSNDAGEIPQSVKASIEALVKQSVGYRDGTDQFSLEFLNFVDPLPIDEPAAAWITWDQVQELLKNISLGVAALVALLLGHKTLKNFKPTPGNNPISLPQERENQMGQLSEMVKQNPDVFSKILASWANDAPSETAAGQTNQAAKRAA